MKERSSQTKRSHSGAGRRLAQNADWTKRDTVLAAEFGLTRERVRQIRKANGVRSSREYGRVVPIEACRRVLAENFDSIRFHTLVSFHAKFCPKLPMRAVKNTAKADKISFNRENTFPFGLLDWRLPNEDLALVWGIRPQAAARKRPAGRKAEFDLRCHQSASDAVRRATLVAAAEATAAEYVSINGAIPRPSSATSQRPESGVPWLQINWLLPNQTLGLVWGVKRGYLAARRCQLGKGASLIGTLLVDGSAEHAEAVRAEVALALSWRAQ